MCFQVLNLILVDGSAVLREIRYSLRVNTSLMCGDDCAVEEVFYLCTKRHRIFVSKFKLVISVLKLNLKK